MKTTSIVQVTSRSRRAYALNAIYDHESIHNPNSQPAPRLMTPEWESDIWGALSAFVFTFTNTLTNHLLVTIKEVVNSNLFNLEKRSNCNFKWVLFSMLISHTPRRFTFMNFLLIYIFFFLWMDTNFNHYSLPTILYKKSKRIDIYRN